MIYHNSFEEEFRCPLGAVPEGAEVVLYIKTDENFDSCLLRLWTHDDKETLYPMEKVDMGFKISTRFEKMGICWYYFILSKEARSTFYCCRENYTGGEGKITAFVEGSFQVTVYDRNLKTPDWFKNSIMYQIFPDRFNRRGLFINNDNTRDIHFNWYEKPNFTPYGAPNNDFFGGNFVGVKDKLMYLKELGVDVIYFNPIFESSSNHRYDTGDYMKIDYTLGSEEEFKDLVDYGKTIGISIILDGVFNHTGSNSRYFNKNGQYEEAGAYQSKESTYYNWYRFESFPDKYECWWDFETLPNINENDESFRKFIYGRENSVISKWMDMGVKGWRLDVADEIPNDFLEAFYTSVKEKDKDSVVIAEVWEDASNKRSYGKMRKYVQGKQFDSIMNYPLRSLIIDFIAYGYNEEGAAHQSIDAYELNQRILNLYNNYPKDIFYSLMNFLSTHDTNRIMTVFEGWEYEKSLSKKAQSDYVPTKEQIDKGTKRLKLAWAFIASFPGVPCIFYGDEIGLTGYKDPFNRGTYPWGNENIEMLDFFKEINKVRKENMVLVCGSLKPLYFKEDIYAFERIYKNESVIFLMNRNEIKSGSVLIDTKNTYMDIKSGQTYNPMYNEKITIDLKPLSFKLIKKIKLAP
jgi:cyclomaltodextrinase / maltogenic alpha-amylase / neopullulanase